MDGKQFNSPEGISIKEYVCDKFENLEKAINARFDSVTRTTDAALASSDKAIAKSDMALEKRLDSVNEFRATLSDQAAKFITRSEFELVANRLEQDIKNLSLARAELLPRSTYAETMKNMQEQIDELRLNRALLEGRASQVSVWIAYLFSALGITLGIIGLFVR